MQSSFRGYLLTEDTTFLDSYNNGLKEIPQLFGQEKELIKNNQEQLPIFDSIQQLHSSWIDYADTIIWLKKNSRLSDASMETYNEFFKSKLRKHVGKKINDEIDGKFYSLDKIEYGIRGVHSKNLVKSIRRTHTISFLFFSLTIVVGLVSMIYIFSLISRRIKTMVELAEKISGGTFTTISDHKNDELTSLSLSLNRMSISLNRNINELERRNIELDKFAYVVSHDLKGPLRGIHNVVKWIEEDLDHELSDELRKYLSIISERVKRMEDLINGMLQLARTREKQSPELVDVNELVNGIIQTDVPRDFEVQIKELPVIIAERLKLEQIFRNLINNAVQYTTSKNGKITIECKLVDDTYQFSVKDNGIGIEKEYHEKIFEMFQTLRDKHTKESTGIGLAIIKKILDDYHCNIWINSSLNNGAEFVFTWPTKI